MIKNYNKYEVKYFNFTPFNLKYCILKRCRLGWLRVRWSSYEPVYVIVQFFVISRPMVLTRPTVYLPPLRSGSQHRAEFGAHQFNHSAHEYASARSSHEFAGVRLI